jgi:serine/threonine-protein kinase
MERLEGETLARRSARTRFDWPAVLAIARQIAGALAAAHGKGIVHRDLKPDNVFLVRDPEVSGGERIKLLDFGIAKLAVESTPTPTVTRTGVVLGTPTYMSPEQCRGVAIDHRADLYSLGCVMYELCCGRPPFRGEGPGDVLASHIHMPMPAMSTATTETTEIPEAVEALVRRLLAKAPGDRLQTADEVIFAIDAVRGEPTIVMDAPPRATSAVGEPATPTPSGSAVIVAQPARGRLRPSTATLLTGMAAILLMVMALVMRRGEDAGPAVTDAVVAAAVPVPAPVRSQPLAPVPAPAGNESGATLEPVRGKVAAAPRREPDPPRPSLPAWVDATIDSAPAGAEVVLGGEVLGTTPFRGQIPRGDRVKLVIRLAGHAARTVAVDATEAIHERVTLTRKPPAAPPKRAVADRDRSVNPFD